MDPLYLRKATSQEHERVEGTLPLMTENLDRATYVSVLKSFYGFVKGWENWAAHRVPEAIRPELEQRRRSLMLERDLAFFQEPLPEDFYCPGLPAESPALLGSMYVLEGSTLGGQFIAAHVEKVLHLNRGEGDAFFVGYGEQTGPMWKRFKSVLADIPEADAETAVAAAKKTFLDFGSWMRKSAPQFAHSGAPGQVVHD